MTRRRLACLAGPVLFLLVILAAVSQPPRGSGAPAAVAIVYHVASTGSDANPGTESQPFRSVQKAVDLVVAGDTIKIHGGTFSGIVRITRSGTYTQPVVVTRAVADSTPMITAALDSLDPFESATVGGGARCDGYRKNPDPGDAVPPPEVKHHTLERTLNFIGADHWILRDVKVHNGITIQGASIEAVPTHMNLDIAGHGTVDTATHKTFATSKGADPADSVQVIGATLTGRGIYGRVSRWPIVKDNDVSALECGSGSGIAFIFWNHRGTIENNSVHDLGAPYRWHWMQDGIRLTSGSDYFLVKGNTVQDLSGKHRALSVDVYGNWNTFEANVMRRNYIGVSEQWGNRGNRYIRNVAESNRNVNYDVSVKEAATVSDPDYLPFLLSQGTKATFRGKSPTDSSGDGRFECNQSLYQAGATKADIKVKASTTTAYLNNNFDQVNLSANLRTNFGSASNTWDGSTTPPPQTPSATSTAGFANCSSPSPAPGA